MFTQRRLKSDCSDVSSVLKWDPRGRVALLPRISARAREKFLRGWEMVWGMTVEGLRGADDNSHFLSIPGARPCSKGFA